MATVIDFNDTAPSGPFTPILPAAGSARYVKTGDIKEAIRGRETEIVDSLGIAWRNGGPHIRCPYPNHEDKNPSWRWDDKACRAVCSCTQQGDGAIDVLAKMEGIDFDDAKVRVAEVLGRDDLIKTKRQPVLGEQRYPSTTAKSLINPPADKRQDDLARVYLASRLGIPADQMIMPVTEWAGWREFPYFDTKASKKGDSPPLFVGNFACAVFGSRSVDGRQHAHRIYVAPGGEGKAELGKQTNGNPRSVKKAAKVAKDFNPTGCAVIWGSIDTAPAVVICEGIETGAAIAFSIQELITSGNAAVAACIDGNGVASFRPWLATQRLIIAADRDEARAVDQRGYQAGEISARKCGFANHQAVLVKIALPGAPGSKTDFLDLFQASGPAAVKATLMQGYAYAPSESELQKQSQETARLSDLEQVERDYPLPNLDSLQLTYLHTKTGEIKVHKAEGTQRNPATGKVETIWKVVATPFSMPSWLAYIDRQNSQTGLRILVRGLGGQPQRIEVERSAIATMGATEILRLMYAVGLRTEGDGDKVVVACLKGHQPPRGIAVLSRPGWHALPGIDGEVFGVPGGSVIGLGAGHQVELSDTAALQDVPVAGTFEAWQQAVATAAIQLENPHWSIGAIVAFAGPILTLAKLDSCGLTFTGQTSLGKTTAMAIAVSAWSSAAVGTGLMQSMRSTVNALEATAQAAHSTILALDEMGLADGRDVGTMIYQIVAGTGKKRLSQRGDLIKPYRWSCFALLSGETSLHRKIVDDGGKWMPGMSVRFPDIDISEVNSRVPKDVMLQIEAVRSNHGHAGPAFVEALIRDGLNRDPQRIRDAVNSEAMALAGLHDDSVHRRAAQVFGILMVAGKMAVAYGVLPPAVQVERSVQWAWNRFVDSTSGAALDPEAQAIDALRAWIMARWDVTIKQVRSGADYGAKANNNQKAEGWFDDSSVYIPSGQGAIERACGGILKEDHLARMLDRRGILARRGEGKNIPVRRIPKIGAVRAYALSRKQLGLTQYESQPNGHYVEPTPPTGPANGLNESHDPDNVLGMPPAWQ